MKNGLAQYSPNNRNFIKAELNLKSCCCLTGNSLIVRNRTRAGDGPSEHHEDGSQFKLFCDLYMKSRRFVTYRGFSNYPVQYIARILL